MVEYFSGFHCLKWSDQESQFGGMFRICLFVISVSLERQWKCQFAATVTVKSIILEWQSLLQLLH